MTRIDHPPFDEILPERRTQIEELRKQLCTLENFFEKANLELPPLQPTLKWERITAIPGYEAPNVSLDLSAPFRQFQPPKYVEVSSEYGRLKKALQRLGGIAENLVANQWGLGSLMIPERLEILLSSAPAILDRCEYLLLHDEAVKNFADGMQSNGANNLATLCATIRSGFEALLPELQVDSATHSGRNWTVSVKAASPTTPTLTKK